MNDDEYKSYLQIHRGELSNEGGIRLLAAVMLLAKMCEESIGEERVFKLLKRWGAVFNMSGILYTRERENIRGKSPKDFYNAMGTWEKEIGDEWEILTENAEEITFAVHDCIFRGACRVLGTDHVEICEMGWGAIMDGIASVIDPRLEWVRIKCSEAPDPCIYKIRYRQPQ